ncbi:MAG TPA: hypothetical protein VFV19_12850 [Candidatus Polarisedimenticolaceae bacterium]|nr:hypothetical protein [Candidatus Polarisedimenticolaceae bacterium]
MGTLGPDGEFATLTHARLRASQGDVAGAARIVRVILRAQPGHEEARAFLASLEGRVAVTYRERREPEPRAAAPAEAAALAPAFRRALDEGQAAARLEAWVERIRKGRGERRAR